MWYQWGTLRQNVANLIFYYFATYFYYNRACMTKKNKVVVLVCGLVCPLFFHSSAVVNIIIFPILLSLREEVNPHFRILWVLVSSIALRVTSSLFLGSLISFAGRIEQGYGDYVGTSTGNILMYLFKISVFVIFCLKYDMIDWKHKKYMLDLFTVMILIVSIDTTIVNRVASYYSLGFYVAMALFYMYFEGNIKLVVLPIFYVALFYLFMRHILFTDDALLSNYCFMWNTPDAKMINNLFWRSAY